MGKGENPINASTCMCSQWPTQRVRRVSRGRDMDYTDTHVHVHVGLLYMKFTSNPSKKVVELTPFHMITFQYHVTKIAHA